MRGSMKKAATMLVAAILAVGLMPPLGFAGESGVDNAAQPTAFANGTDEGATLQAVPTSSLDMQAQTIDQDAQALQAQDGSQLEIAQVEFRGGAIIMSSGDLYQVGTNSFKGTHQENPTPTKALSGIAQIAFGGTHSAYITTSGDLYMWGSNDYGQLGDGTTERQSKPVKVRSDVAQVSLGYGHSAYITTSGDLYLWGNNSNGQIGDNTTINRTEPVKMLSDVAQVSLGSFHSAALTTSGDLYVWGQNNWGQVGNGTKIDCRKPVKVLSDVTQVSLGDYHSAALTSTGDLYLWGANNYYQLGNGTKTECHEPTKLLSDVAQVAVGSYSCGAITTSGDLYVWGNNIGAGHYDDKYIVEPKKVLSDVKSASLGSRMAAAITTAGELFIWGDYSFEEPMGNPLGFRYNTPTCIFRDGIWLYEQMELFAGSTRYETARMMVEAACEQPYTHYEGAIVVSGNNGCFPDALSAAGLTGVLDYPLVVVDGKGLNDANRSALDTLKAQSPEGELDIVIVGGTGVVTEEVESDLAAWGTVSKRIAGNNRYATNAAVYEYGLNVGKGWWGNSSFNKSVFIATGENYPDALSIAPYLSRYASPIVLVKSKATKLPAGIKKAVAAADRVVVLGGTGAVTDALMNDAKAACPSKNAIRIGGSTRYKTSALIAKWVLGRSTRFEYAGFATGENFPDALASGFLLGQRGSVLMLVSPKASKNTDMVNLLKASKLTPSKLRAFGGTSAVPLAIRNQIAAAAGWTLGAYQLVERE